uniref:Uncharacterized protein n=1 Tax=Neovison vison TaxID=452646 RepID=A0A8C7B1I9_NEOVI
MAQVDQGGHELQGPEADVGNGEEVVVADIGAARLLGVAVKVLLLVPPHALCGHYIHQHAEDEHHRQPDAPERRRVLVHAAQEGLERLPVHGAWWGCRGPLLKHHLSGLHRLLWI